VEKLAYKEYLISPHWQYVRKTMLKYADYRCQICNAGNTPMHIHHRCYDNLGNEPPADLIVVCERCHKFIHKHLFEV